MANVEERVSTLEKGITFLKEAKRKEDAKEGSWNPLWLMKEEFRAVRGEISSLKTELNGLKVEGTAASAGFGLASTDIKLIKADFAFFDFSKHLEEKFGYFSERQQTRLRDRNLEDAERADAFAASRDRNAPWRAESARSLAQRYRDDAQANQQRIDALQSSSAATVRQLEELNRTVQELKESFAQLNR